MYSIRNYPVIPSSNNVLIFFLIFWHLLIFCSPTYSNSSKSKNKLDNYFLKIHNFVKISQLLQREKQIKDSSSPNNSYGNINLFASPGRFIRKLKIKKNINKRSNCLFK